MRLLGLIGGTSYHSTIVYYRLINEMVGDEIGNQANPPLLLYSLNIELMRAGIIEEINAQYLEIALTLQRAGAEGIVICANTPHLVYQHVQPELDIPILHIAEATGREAKRLGLQKLGLLGNRPTMTRGFIPDYLQSHFGIKTIIPNNPAVDQSHHYVAEELTRGRFTDHARQFYIRQMDELRNHGAQGIILGCTELPILLNKEDFELPMLQTTQLHARMAVDFILGND